MATSDHPDLIIRSSYEARGEPDRDEACQDALEGAVIELMGKAEAAGWHRAEVQGALLTLTMNDLWQTAGAEAAAEILEHAAAAIRREDSAAHP